ncbi:MAG: Mrp/NBP35 family ATP-binding protein [Candidatus Cardinium sp.]|uniref:Mrp/NBP35 family ATP-binding protein n=1 Tax=Cardinium endosymbiont of Dermatophagoides farinae TaxID=2597823 RepID=UPI001182C04C|nr:Mrp/NBP35 family ATP-binding protein [Cardinium endosymbiont of Dermatophagoides farinae]TSJ80648.1 Mrp/NBP35 family ATP-binding protein [Cardinium endosymbiont of Dermatophagoides farinae]UWW96643.1 MAG: Mrp/NBP35 family ATP-binding protein [Candidatus Cardinium sp.]
MTALKKKVLAALRRVEDPDLKKDLVSLGMIDQLHIDQTTISFTIILTTPACPLQEMIKQACIQAIRDQVTDDFEIVITFTSKVTSRRSKPSILPGVKNIIAIASGKGGVGKSTIATHLALALSSHGAAVGLLDADIFGPSIPIMWGCETTKPTVVKEEGKHLIIPINRHNVKLLSIGFLSNMQEAIVWRGPMASAAFKQLLQDADWGALDYLLIDLPPGTSDIHLTLVQTVSITGAVVVTTPQKIALIDAIKAIAMFQKEQIQVPILGLIENMSYFHTGKEDETNLHYIFGKDGGKRLAEKASIPFLGQIPLLPTICWQGDLGTIPTIIHFKKIAEMLAQQVAIQNATFNLI